MRSPHAHINTSVSWPAEPCKEVWTGEVRRRRRVSQRDGLWSSSERAGRFSTMSSPFIHILAALSLWFPCLDNLYPRCLNLNGFFRYFTWTHLVRVQVSMPWPGTLSLTALTIKDFNLFPLITLHPSCPTNTPTVSTSLHSCTWRRLITSVISPFHLWPPRH